MARNKGFIPAGPGELSVQRKQLKAIIESLLPACIEPDIETGVPFRAQAIIANPPAYGEFIEVIPLFSSSLPSVFYFSIDCIYVHEHRIYHTSQGHS